MKQRIQSRKTWLPVGSRSRCPLIASLFLAALTALLACAGCSKSGPAPAATSGDPSELAEVTRFRKAFELADTKTKFSVNEMIQMVRSGTYADAVSTLQKFGSTPQLTPEQKQSVQDLSAKLQAQMAETGSK